MIVNKDKFAETVDYFFTRSSPLGVVRRHSSSDPQLRKTAYVMGCILWHFWSNTTAVLGVSRWGKWGWETRSFVDLHSYHSNFKTEFRKKNIEGGSCKRKMMNHKANLLINSCGQSRSPLVDPSWPVTSPRLVTCLITLQMDREGRVDISIFVKPDDLTQSDELRSHVLHWHPLGSMHIARLWSTFSLFTCSVKRQVTNLGMVIDTTNWSMRRTSYTTAVRS